MSAVRRRRVRLSRGLVVLFGIWACSDGGTGPEDPTAVESVEVTPATHTFTSIGETAQFDAIAKNADGQAINQKNTFNWTSSDEAIATVVAETGEVTAVANGPVTIRASIENVTGSAQVTVQQAPGKLAFTEEPGTTAAGGDLGVEVQIQDARGNLIATATDEVTLALGANAAGGTLSGTKTVAAKDGVAAFPDVSIDKVGSGYTLVATLGSISTTSGEFTISASAPAKLAFVASPEDQVAGEILNPSVKVEILDAFGNRMVDANDPVTLEIADHAAGGTLSGTATVDAIDGLATFVDLFTKTAGIDYQLTATSGSLEAAMSEPFTIRPDVPTQLAFRVPPTDTEGNEPIPLEVEVQDRFGNTAYNAPSKSVTVALGNNPGPTGILGTLTVDTDDGVAIFADVRIPSPGAGYTLVVSSDLLPEITSAAFNINLTFTAVAEGDLHTCGITEPGHAYCWGLNDKGQLGLGTVDPAVTQAATPRLVAGDLRFSSISLGWGFTCALTMDDAAYCWGQNDLGQTGIGTNEPTNEPKAVKAPAGVAFAMLDAGGGHICGVTHAQATYCWGYNNRGQLGTGASGTNSNAPVQLTIASLQAISAGGNHTCGLATDGTLLCWGDNGNGQTGTNSAAASLPSPTVVTGDRQYSEVMAGDNHTCGITDTGETYCWGNNLWGQVGNNQNGQTRVKTKEAERHCHGTPVGSLCFGTWHLHPAEYTPFSDRRVMAPVQVAGGHEFVALATGAGDHSCAITAAGVAMCWGSHAFGQLGAGSLAPCGGATELYKPPPGGECADVPVEVAGAHPFTALSAGRDHTCAIDPSEGAGAFCWGLNDKGQLGLVTPGGSYNEPQRIVQN